ncbi:MAG: pyruvate ferredoxin oxidoreductase [Clostridiales Family XIII bacterium]|jgi:pyruvate ferredoxin oxidoreductase beta subunit|nr:pyruvate ferredoxin oxidoreductase [Clostridiales Family XIII bacterium]
MSAYTAYSLKNVANVPERLAPGHRMCAGCGSTIGIRAVLRALKPEDQAVITCATSCLEVSSCTYPYSSWNDSFIHTAFECAAATTSGVEAAYTAMKKKGKLDETYKFITFGGDGGTYDIGFQSLSGAMERGTDMVYVCYDNEAYMNTGIQRSSSTPQYADTTTSAVGSKSDGKPQFKKDLTKIMAAHHIPYVAQTTYIGNFKDIHQKSEVAIYTEGPAFLNIFAPCPRGWRYDESNLMDVCKAAVESCVWPLFEVINGEWVLNYEPKKKLPVADYLAMQGRFKHLFKPENEYRIQQLQDEVDARWDELRSLCGVV